MDGKVCKQNFWPLDILRLGDHTLSIMSGAQCRHVFCNGLISSSPSVGLSKE